MMVLLQSEVGNMSLGYNVNDAICSCISLKLLQNITTLLLIVPLYPKPIHANTLIN